MKRSFGLFKLKIPQVFASGNEELICNPTSKQQKECEVFN